MFMLYKVDRSREVTFYKPLARVTSSTSTNKLFLRSIDNSYSSVMFML